MLTSQQCFKKFGPPEKESNMVLWEIPKELQVGKIPKRLYCNNAIIFSLRKAFENLISRGFIGELKSFDGCFHIRNKRGLNSMSLHSWGVAIDVNASTNQLGKKPTLSEGFVKCFTDAEFDWGGTWKRLDGMHFQLKKI